MNRLCIYLTYNKEKKLYDYIGRVLQSLRECCQKVCLVCNYDRIEEGQEYARSYADQIFCRENRGYDSGAYKDMLCRYLGWDEVEKYDEIILANDSFFGFFYPLQDTFRLMEQGECDYWGMTGQAAGEYRNPLREFDAHIHSYFMVFRKNIIESKAFRDFWEELAYPQNFRQAIVNFELGINERLKACGFIGKSYIDLYQIQLGRNENPCYSKTLELVEKYRMPVMKKKCLLVRSAGFEDTLRTLAFLNREKRYSMEWMIPFLENQFYIPGTGDGVCNSLEIFYHNHPEVYIYGTGMCGKGLSHYFAHKGWEYKGHIVTDKNRTDIPAYDMEEADIGSDTGIVISVVDPGIAEEIAAHIGGRCSRDQLFFISDCAAIRMPE